MPKISNQKSKISSGFRALYNRKTTDEYHIFIRNKNERSFVQIGIEITRKEAETFVKQMKLSYDGALFKIVKKRKNSVKEN